MNKTLACLALFLVVLRIPAATYWVLPRIEHADDAGPGSKERPFKTLSAAVKQSKSGDTVIIGDGVYREQILIRANGTKPAPVTFEAAPGAHVVVTGADRLTNWQVMTGRVYQVPWPHRFIGWSPHMTHPDDEYHRLIGRCEQVFVENYPLRQVLERHQLAPGTFFSDISNQVLLACDAAGRDLNKVLVEGSVRQELLRVEGAYVRVSGLSFRFAANMAQHGAVVLAGSNDVLEDCTVERMNASGAAFTGPDQVVRRCLFQDNGQLGFGANGAHNLLFTECVVRNNNVKGFDRGWEAGGDKLVLCRNAVLERSQFVQNRGNGVWFDIGNEHCSVRQCLIADNEDAGIFDEISFGLQAHDNVIVGNGFASTSGAWGAQAGIVLSSSPDSVVERNLIIGNREGFNFREQTRTTPRIDQNGEVPVWNHNELIRGNIIAFNRDAQLWGWFDMPDNRHWPAGYAANQTAMTLESLRLRFEDNVYFAGAGQGLFSWGVTWRKHENYTNLESFRGALGIDSGGAVTEPKFAEVAARDFKLSKGDFQKLHVNYPNGPVPGVALNSP